MADKEPVFGPVQNADETRQAQHTNSNDTPTDVNMNAVVCRAQAAGFTVASNSAADRADRRGSMFDHIAAIHSAAVKPG